MVFLKMASKKHIREVKKIVKQEGLNLVDVKQTKKHMKVTVKLQDGTQRLLFTGLTPSDYRCYRNFANDCRKVKGDK